MRLAPGHGRTAGPVPLTRPADREGGPRSSHPARARLYRAAGPLSVLLVFAAFHLPLIDADTPPRLGVVKLDGGAFCDEGYKAYDARNMALFGATRWTPHDDYGGNWTEGSPINTWITRATFAVAGVDLTALRLVNLTFALGCLALCWGLLHRRFGPGPAFWGLLLLALHPLVNVYARLALLELKLLFFALLAVVLLPEEPSTDRRSVIRLALVGLAVAGAFYTKETALIFAGSLAAGLAAWLVCTLVRSPTALRLGAAGLAGGALAGAAAVQLACAERGACSFLHARALDPPLRALPDLLIADLFLLNPALGALGLLGVAAVLRRALGGSPGPPHDLVAVSWLVLPTIFFSLLVYQPDRYFLLPLPALVWLAVQGLAELRSLNAWLLGPRPTAWSVPVTAGVLLLVTVHFTPTLLAGFEIGSDRGILPRSLVGPPYGPWIAAAMLGVALVLRFAGKTLRQTARRLMRPALVAMAVGGTALGVVPIASWAADPHYGLAGAADALDALGDDAVLVGDWAPQLVLPTDLRAIYSNWNEGMGHRLNVENLAEIGATHVALVEGINDGYRRRLERLYPGALADEPLLRFDYGGRIISIHEFRSGASTTR